MLCDAILTKYLELPNYNYIFPEVVTVLNLFMFTILRV